MSLTVNAPVAPLRGSWQFEDNVLDSSTFGNNGTALGSPSYVTGQIGKAISLSGSGQYVTVPDNNSLDLTSGMTLATWIRPGVGATQALIQKATQGSVNGYELSLASPTSPAGQKASSASTNKRPPIPTGSTRRRRIQRTGHGCMSPQHSTGRRSASNQWRASTRASPVRRRGSPNSVPLSWAPSMTGRASIGVA